MEFHHLAVGPVGGVGDPAPRRWWSAGALAAGLSKSLWALWTAHRPGAIGSHSHSCPQCPLGRRCPWAAPRRRRSPRPAAGAIPRAGHSQPTQRLGPLTLSENSTGSPSNVRILGVLGVGAGACLSKCAENGHSFEPTPCAAPTEWTFIFYPALRHGQLRPLGPCSRGGAGEGSLFPVPKEQGYLQGFGLRFHPRCFTPLGHPRGPTPSQTSLRSVLAATAPGRTGRTPRATRTTRLQPPDTA